MRFSHLKFYQFAVSDLEIIFLRCNFLLDLAVGVIDDGQEHVEQDKEHEKDVGEEEDGPHHPVGLLQGVEVKVPEDCPQQREDGVWEAAVVLDLKLSLTVCFDNDKFHADIGDINLTLHITVCPIKSAPNNVNVFKQKGLWNRSYTWEPKIM